MKYLLPILALFMLIGCSDQSKKDVAEVTKKVKNVDMEKVVQKSKEKVSEVTKAVQAVEVEKVVKEATKKVETVTKEVIKKTEDVTKKVTEKVNTALDSVQKTSAMPTIAKIPTMGAVETKSAVDGVSLFASKCASCHGANAQKKALGQSQIIAGWSKDKTIAAIKGYKDGSYGKAMKGLMKGQVSSLSDAEVTALAEAISKK